MTQQQSTKSSIERAFEIASSGTVSTVDEIARRLDHEGYFGNKITGPTLLKQLRERINAGAAAVEKTQRTDG